MRVRLALILGLFITKLTSMINELNERSRDILRLVVESYLETGSATGSKYLSQSMEGRLSSATIRNVLADLESMGLLYAPHISAGRMPTANGLRIFVDGLLESSELNEEDRRNIQEIEQTGQANGFKATLEKASEVLSGLSSCASLVFTPKLEKNLKQIEFVPLGNERVLVVLVSEGGMVENRVLELGPDFPVSALTQASNYLNSMLQGKTLAQARQAIQDDIEARKTHLDLLSEQIIEKGLGIWSNADGGHLIVKGQSHLLADVQAMEELEQIRQLFNALETEKNIVNLLEHTEEADGVKIFIGSENTLFNLSGCSMIVAPYKDKDNQMVGALGVIGPARLNYSRIIPMVDYTSHIISKLIR